MRTLILGATLSLVLAGAASAQSTAFTYQGRLKNGGQPAAGLHDFRFRLFDAATGGIQIGTAQCADNVAVSEGLFTTMIDFGQQFATPSARFLEIEVRADSGQNCTNATGFTVLGPRQLLTAAPLANHAKSAFALDAPDGSPLNAVYVDNGGNVGIGTTAPTSLLHVLGATVLENTGDQADLLWLATERSWVFRQEGTGAPTALKLQSVGGGGNKDFIIQTDGRVGIGTTSPAAKLHVNGNLRVTGPVTSDTRLQRFKTIHGSTFQPRLESGDSDPVTIRYTDGIVGVRTTGGTCQENYYYAPVELPDGAVITNVLFTYYDNGPCGIYGELYRLNLFNGQLNVMVNFPFEDFNGTTVKTVSSSNIAFATVDNSTYAYVLRIHMGGFSRESGAYMRILGARIRYETNILYP